MKCVYSKDVALTKEQIEGIEKALASICEVFESIAETISEVWNNLVKHPFFKDLCKLYLGKSDKPVTQYKPIDWVQPKYHMPPIPKLDKRCRLHVIRNNC